jgi:hypothetical protein
LRAKAKKKADRTLHYSFFLTITILTAAAVVFNYIASLRRVQHLPQTYDFKRADWMKYVPMGAEKITIINFSQIFIKTGNESFLPNDRLLVIYNFKTELKVYDIEFSVSALYRNPDPNSEDIALNILRPKQHIYLELEKELKEKGEIIFPYKNHTIVQVTGHIVNKPIFAPKPTPEYVKGYIAMHEGYILYSEGMRGLDLVKQSLDTMEEPTQFFEQQQVKASLYLLLSEAGGELGFSYSTFPYTVSSVLSTSTSVCYEGGFTVTRHVFSFSSAEEAQNSLDDIKKANPDATEFQIVDNYIVVIAKYGSDLLLRELRFL